MAQAGKASLGKRHLSAVKGGENRSQTLSGRKASQAEGTASAKALKERVRLGE